MFCIALGLAALGLGGCLQDAYNADKDFNFNNVNDPNAQSSTGLQILEIDTGLNVATIFNNSSSTQDMTNWTLVDTTSTFNFPSGFIMSANLFVRVRGAAGTNTTTDLFSSGMIWTGGTIATLNNGSGIQISTCQVGNPAGC